MRLVPKQVSAKSSLISIILGTITTILFVWVGTLAGEYWKCPPNSESVYFDKTGQTWLIGHGSMWNADWISCVEKRNLKYTHGPEYMDVYLKSSPVLTSLPFWAIDNISSTPYHKIVVCVRGWPFRCLKSVAYIEVGSFGSSYKVAGGESVNILNSGYHMNLPFTPMWYGFLFDTILFSIIWIYLIPVPIAIIQYLISKERMQRGLCPNCDYDLKRDFQAGCPECEWNRNESDNESTLK